MPQFQISCINNFMIHLYIYSFKRFPVIRLLLRYQSTYCYRDYFNLII